ncbi:Aste57867_16785 [Aphanomyces stellatus]|uniref:Aste57867_16785 protein n=1 Tax=Aphanomyces stellatus TaxID=120398 RepID=A0A485L7S8_9STRA|nr:hypothetical protein As57867_016728 [Aphanomyces stellatus]VFT93550.1 Aste57867_16785 [Aphanomyces stellatus]
MDDGVRDYESERKRRYRATQRSSREALEAEVAFLEKELQRRTHAIACAANDKETASRRAIYRRLSERTNRLLHDQVRHRRVLLCTLHAWVSQLSIQPALRHRQPWLHSTLLEDPTARHYGFRWLTDRVFHSAVAIHGAATPTMSMDDMARVDVHANVASSDDDAVAAIESQSQSTIFFNVNDVAMCLWDLFADKNRSNANVLQVPHSLLFVVGVDWGIQILTVLCDGNILYALVHDTLHDSSLCVLLRRYIEPHRVVFAKLFLRDDECYPLEPHQLRPHGFGWTIMEQITDDVTLYRSRLVQFEPVTLDGGSSLDRTAAMFGATPHPTSRDVTLARIQTHAQRNLLLQRHHTTRDLNDRLTKQSRMAL